MLFRSNVSFGEDGDWTEAKILLEQFHDVKGNDLDQFRGDKVETILEPSSMRSGALIEPYSGWLIGSLVKDRQEGWGMPEKARG